MSYEIPVRNCAFSPELGQVLERPGSSIPATTASRQSKSNADHRSAITLRFSARPEVSSVCWLRRGAARTQYTTARV